MKGTAQWLSKHHYGQLVGVSIKEIFYFIFIFFYIWALGIENGKRLQLVSEYHFFGSGLHSSVY